MLAKNTVSRPINRTVNTVPNLPQKYEDLVCRICGEDWRRSSKQDIEGAIGVAICKAIMNGESASTEALSRHLGVHISCLITPFDRLFRNGMTVRKKLTQDKQLVNGDDLAWCYVAGIASGCTGVGSK